MGRVHNQVLDLMPDITLRNTVNGAPLYNLDATGARTFHPAEKAWVQCRAEFFNVANRPNYALIGRLVNVNTFGIVQSQLPSRQVQFGVKLGF
jgi:hypothetical protein